MKFSDLPPEMGLDTWKMPSCYLPQGFCLVRQNTMLGRPSPRRRGGMNLELNDSVDSWFRPREKSGLLTMRMELVSRPGRL